MEESQSQSSVDSSQHQTPPSELDVWIRTVCGKKKGRVYGLGLESTALMPTSKFPRQSSFPVQWLNSKEFQEQVRKQVEDEVKEVNARVQAAEQERDELRRRVEHNERMLQDILANINFQPAATPATHAFNGNPSQRTGVDPYQMYRGQGSQWGEEEDDAGEDKDEEE